MNVVEEAARLGWERVSDPKNDERLIFRKTLDDGRVLDAEGSRFGGASNAYLLAYMRGVEEAIRLDWDKP